MLARAAHGMLPFRMPRRAGFTLIEVLVFIAIMAMLLSVVLVAVNPEKNLGVARDAQRRSDLNAVLDSIFQYFVKYERLPNGIPLDTEREICRAPTYTGDFCFHAADLVELTDENLLNNLPVDPQAPLTGTGTRYWIKRDQFSRVTVRAPFAEQAGSGGIVLSR